jgi:hypothetical protein
LSPVGLQTGAELAILTHEGIGRDGHVLKLPMARQSFFGKMTEQDLNGIVAWVRTI